MENTEIKMGVKWEITEKDGKIISRISNENGLFHFKEYHKDNFRPFGKCAECEHSKFNNHNFTYDCPIVREYRMDRFRTSYDNDCDCYKQKNEELI